MFRLGLQGHQVDNIDNTNLQLRDMAPQQIHGSQRLQGRNVAGASQDHIRLALLIIARPPPYTDTRAAVSDGRIHIQPLESGLFSCDDDVDEISGTKALVGNIKKGIRVRRKINANNACLLVEDKVDKTRVLMGKAVMVLTPYMRCQQIIEGSNRTPPG